VIGLHFFSPAHVMKLLEVVVADHTTLDVTATGFALGKMLGKISVRAGVCDGFIGNRMLAVYRTAADHMVLDGASPYQIDKALVDFGFAMGPYAVADLAGLDGEGYYIYEKGKRGGTPNPKIPDLIAAEQAELGITPRPFTDEEIVRRYMCAMVNEGSWVLSEGIATRPEGLPEVLADIETYAKEDPHFWAPSTLLRDLVAEDLNYDSMN